MSGRDVPWFAVINLGNSIIGVSILAMPWCFRECGVLLATLLILFCGFMTKVSCSLLLRASKATRRYTYEFLAYHTLGATGKLAVEFSIIGLLMCTMVAFFVIMGDLGPAIVSKWCGFENSWELRVCLLVIVALVIVLPLGLRRSIESLGNISTMSIAFYVLFSADIILNSVPNLTSGVWLKDLVLIRPEGTLKGLSIFALAFSCQTVLFVVYESLPERTPKQMETVVNRAVGMVSSVYIVVGFFGYVTFNQLGIKGDILLNFAPGLVSEILRLGFTLSVALSFPLVIFPCRASIYTLFFSQSHSLENPHGGGGDYIPPSMFKIITLILVVFTLILGITIPNVETILGLTGATLGCLICFIYPALIYLSATGVPNRNTGKIVLVVGLLLLICSTYDNLQSMQKDADVDIPHLDIEKEIKLLEDAANKDPHRRVDIDNKPLGRIDDVKMVDKIEDGKLDLDPKKMIEKIEEEKLVAKPVVGEQLVDKGDAKDLGQKEVEQLQEHLKVVNEKRQEPPIPHAPDDVALKDVVDKEAAIKDKVDEVEKILAAAEEKLKDEEEKGIEKEDTEFIGKEDSEKMKDEKKEDAKEKVEKDVEEKVIEQEQKQEEHEKELKEIKKDIDQASLEKIVEEKVVEHEIKQEEQDKQLKEIKEQQKRQEEIIKQQAEELEKLRVQHEEEQKEKEQEKEQKEKEEQEKLEKEKEDAERKAKQDKLLKQQEELQQQQKDLQQQQQLQQLQQQLQQLPADQFQPQVGVGLPQQQGGAAVLPGGLPQDGLQQPAAGLQQQPAGLQQPAGGFINQGLQPQQLGDGVVPQVGVQQPQVPLVPQQQVQQAAVGGQPLIPQQAGVGGQPLMQQQVGVGGQPLIPQQPGGQPLGQQLVDGQLPLQDGGGLNLQQGLGVALNQQVAAVQGNIAQQQNQIPIDRPQRSPQDALQQQQGMGVPQQDMGIQQQNLQQMPVGQDTGLQQQLDQQQIVQQPINQQMLQQQSLDQLPGLGQNDLANLNNLVVDSKAVNRQLKIADDSANTDDNRHLKLADESADTHMPKSNDKTMSHVSKDIDDKVLNFDSRNEINLNKHRTYDGGDDNVQQDVAVPHQVLDVKDDSDMELAKSLEQQLNSQFKPVGNVAQVDGIKKHNDQRRKEEVKR